MCCRLIQIQKQSKNLKRGGKKRLTSCMFFNFSFWCVGAWVGRCVGVWLGGRNHHSQNHYHEMFPGEIIKTALDAESLQQENEVDVSNFSRSPPHQGGEKTNSQFISLPPPFPTPLPLLPPISILFISIEIHSCTMDTLGIEPRASRMLSGCDTTTPCAQ